MVMIGSKEAASLTQFNHNYNHIAAAVVPQQPSPPPGSTLPRLGMFVTKLGHPGDVFNSSLLSTAKRQGAASSETQTQG